MMTSKQMKRSTSEQLKAAEALLTTRSAHETTLLDKLDLDADQRACAQGFHDYVFEQLTQSAQTLEAKDLAVAVERQDDDPIRAARDQAAAALYTILSRARPALQSAMDEDAARYGIEGDTPRRAEALHSFASRVIGLMEHSPATFTDMFGAELKTANIVAALKPPVAALKALVDKNSIEGSELNTALDQRDEAAERLIRHTRAASLIQQALFLLADEEELWDKSRG